MITFSCKKTLDVPCNGVCGLIICSLIKKTPSNQNWDTLLPFVQLVSCIQLCWFSGIFLLFSLILRKTVLERMGQVLCLHSLFEVPAYEQSNSSVKKEAHSTFWVCFVLSHEGIGVLLSHFTSQDFQD